MSYSFDEQLKLGKMGEKIIFDFLRNQKETEQVIDFSEKVEFQSYGIDGLWVYSNPSTGLFEAEFFDVKTDYMAHKTNKLFIEVSAENADGGILTTKAQYFFYYDPYLGKMYQLSIYAIKNWYEREGIAFKHVDVIGNNAYITSGIPVDINFLKEKFIIMKEFKVAKLNFEECLVS